MQVIITLCKMTKLTVEIVAFKGRLSNVQDLSEAAGDETQF